MNNGVTLAADLEQDFLRPLGRVMGRLVKDEPDVSLDAIFFFARSFGDDNDELFQLAAHYINSGRARNIVINGSDGESVAGCEAKKAWAGKQAWIERFQAFGITNILLGAPALHSREENNAFLDLAIQNKWRAVGLLTQPYQAMRFMLGQLKANKERDYPLRMYALCPLIADWNESVHGPQGADLLPRWAHAELETMRCIPYALKGDLCTVSELEQYLETRSEMSV